MGEQLTLRGTLTGHGGWVTAIATTSEDPNMILSASRDKVRILHTPSSLLMRSHISNPTLPHLSLNRPSSSGR